MENMAYDEDDNMTLSQFAHSGGPRSILFNQASMVTFNQADLPSTSRRVQEFSGKDKAKQCAFERAEELQENLDPQFPSLVKTMIASYVTCGFVMGLTAAFCNLHLQKQDFSMTLVDEDLKEYKTKFIFEKKSLTAGWKAFVTAHDLVVDDALVFQLVEDTKFQVYIIRAYSLGAIDGKASPVTQRKSLDPNYPSAIKGNATPSTPQKSLDQNNQVEIIKTSEQTSNKRQRPDSLAAFEPLKEEKSGSDSEDDDLEIIEGTRVRKHIAEFKDVKNFESFSIVANGLIIDSSFSLSTRTKYYKLCCSQENFLHENLLKGMNMKFVTGAISQAVDLAESIKASKFTTSLHHFEEWDKSLEALETIGMNVSFLRNQLQRLIMYKSKAAEEMKRCKEAETSLSRVEEEINPVRAKLAELKNEWEVLVSEVESRKEKASTHEMNFQCEVDAPWERGSGQNSSRQRFTRKENQ